MKKTYALAGLVALLIVGACVVFGGVSDAHLALIHPPVAADVVMAMTMVLPGLPQPKLRGILSVRAEGAPGDVKAAIEAVNKAFETFKSTHAEKEKEISKRFDDVVTTDKLERVNSSVGDLQKAIDDINAKIVAAQLGAGSEEVKDREYTDAFRAHFRKGEVQASLNKGADDEGGYLAPVEWDRTIVDKLVEISPMRQIAQVQTISGAGFKKLFNLRGTGSGWVGETAARPETATPEFGPLTFTPGELYANPAATQQMLDDAEINLEQWLASEVETEFAYQEGVAFVSGNGTNKPNGFLTYVTGAANAAAHPLGAIALKTAASATAIVTDELIDLVYMLPQVMQQNARFATNRNALGTVRKLKDGDGNYIWQPSFQIGQPSQLLGYPVTEMAAMPNIAASAVPIAFGDFRRGYLVIDRTGVRVLRDPYSNKPYVMFYTTKRVGGGVQDPQAIKALKMAAT
ncbi:phage major capsid protein [Neorhizobium sp. T786]|uniref:phage major capsid protein n=1 Tax=Pseudorhizobium xiangyangii TaxID=2883104 RepID=UPI001CFFF0B4|nr:phage major capsid protein [Neorhizobium xiangyangii]MCB5201893.1 phage major capsid protein [Neorhizobium xiangyangii]